MATIQKVSGIDFANISKFDGVDISAVGSINLIGKPATGTLLLDTTYGSGAEAAYSVRKLRTAYTGAAIQVQRTVGSFPTQEIGFDVNGNLDTATLLAYASGSEVGVSIWYDQSTNGNNAAQISVASRPIVVAAGGALVEENGRSSLDFDGTDDYLKTSNGVANDEKLTFFGVHKQDRTNGPNITFCLPANATAHTSPYFRVTQLIDSNPAGDITYYINAVKKQSGFTYPTIQSAFSFNTFAGTSYLSGTQALNTAGALVTYPTSVPLVIGANAVGAERFNGNFQELIAYPSDKSIDRTQIEENVGDYFTQNPSPYLLDTYTGAAAAYSLRKLRTNYTGFAIKVQDNVGGATQDIGFNIFGELDTVSLLQYAGSNDVFVEIWFDQSGSGNDAEQPSSTLRPKIVSSGTVIVDANGKVAIEGFGNTSPKFLQTASIAGDSGPVSVFAVRNATGSSNTEGIIIDHSDGISFSSSNGFRFDCYNNTYRFGTNSNFTTSSLSLPTGQELQSGVANSSGRTLYIDGSSVATTSGNQTTTGTTQKMTVFGTRYSSSLPFEGTIQEVVLYTGASDGDQSGNRTGIETNINTFYDIYTPTPDPLLLNLYPGSSAAYSLRKLNANYTGSAIKVQDTVGGATKAIGFDANGDLDTAELLAYAGSNDVFVEAWFDQSGSGNDAEQPSSTLRPKIVSSGTVIVDANGKPAVEFDGSNDFITSSFTASAQPVFYAFVFAPDSTTAKMRVFDGNGSDSLNNRNNLVLESSSIYSLDAGNTITGGTTTANQQLISIDLDTSNSFVYKNGAQIISGNAGTRGVNSIRLGTTPTAANQFFDGTMQEVILWDSEQSANRTGIETNINTFYSIY